MTVNFKTLTQCVRWSSSIFIMVVSLLLLHADGSLATDTDEGVILISLAQTSDSHALYTVNPTTGQYTKIFDFSGEPLDKEGKIFNPRVSDDGKTVFFHSNNASAWVPADYNLFGIGIGSHRKNQITPDAASGKWNQPGPYGTVTGKVLDGWNNPIINSPVYIEGMPLVATDAHGEFRVENVPVGPRFIMAYTPSYAYYGYATVNVVAGLTYGPVTLTPQTKLVGTKAKYSEPIPFADRIYHKFQIGGSFAQDIKYTDLSGNTYTTVYHTDMDACFASVQGYDVGPLTGDILVANFATGCWVPPGQPENPYHNGIYIMDKDGNNPYLLHNMNADGWDTSFLTANSFKIFWSPDESRFAVQGEIKDGGVTKDRIAIYSISQGIVWISGDVKTDNGTQKIFCYGWSPDGKWILYAQHDGNPSQMQLNKIRVKDDGSFDLTTNTTILTGGPFIGGTWGKSPASSSSPWMLFTPVIINAIKH